jgi:hypothetical protein
MIGIDRDIHDVPRIDVARHDQVADELAGVAVEVERAEADRARLRELAANIDRDHGVG